MPSRCREIVPVLLAMMSIIAEARRLSFGVVRAGKATSRGGLSHSLGSATDNGVVILQEAFTRPPRRNLKHHIFTARRFLHAIPRGGATAVEPDDDNEGEILKEDLEATEDREEAEEEDQEDLEEEEQDESSAPTSPAKPLTILVKTSLGNSVLDTSVELTVNSNRNVASVKETLRRQLPGRPPTGAFEIVHEGQRLKDSILVQELLDDIDDDDDEDDEEENSEYHLILHLDMIPPVDPKFAPDLQRGTQHMTTSQLLDAYSTNEAALHHNAAMLLENSLTEENGDDEEEVVETVASDSYNEANDNADAEASFQPLLSSRVREQASRFRLDLESKLLDTPHAQKLLSQKTTPAEELNESLQATQVRGDRVRRSAVTSVRASFQQQIQHNLNIDWAVSIRNFTLFLFFGYFGGRTPLSRAILLLGAPSVFVLQARPVKHWLLQLLYTFLYDRPPAIVLSLLPAPQQSILSTQRYEAMKMIYGDLVDLSAFGVKGTPVATPLGTEKAKPYRLDRDDSEEWAMGRDDFEESAQYDSDDEECDSDEEYDDDDDDDDDDDASEA